eukprot:4001788-Alexandrium_andersonii.AAC.1
MANSSVPGVHHVSYQLVLTLACWVRHQPANKQHTECTRSAAHQQTAHRVLCSDPLRSALAPLSWRALSFSRGEQQSS